MHPLIHAESSVKKWGGEVQDYILIHKWFDETKGWIGHSKHRLFRHHSEGIFECEQIFGEAFTNSDDKVVYTRYVAERHVREDCFGYIPTAKEWIDNIHSKNPPEWMIRTKNLND
tara:strand:- start:791 stop:1135 length:345 start_codon:yes stop_codon:yes gene_type:complete